jgi:hypothetical protein
MQDGLNQTPSEVFRTAQALLDKPGASPQEMHAAYQALRDEYLQKRNNIIGSQAPEVLSVYGQRVRKLDPKSINNEPTPEIMDVIKRSGQVGETKPMRNEAITGRPVTPAPNSRGGFNFPQGQEQKAAPMLPPNVPPPEQREIGKKYVTPKGVLRWTNEGWVK